MAFWNRNSVTASAAIVASTDKRSLKRAAAAYRPWQDEAWVFYDKLTEVRYPANYSGRGMSRFTLHIGVYPEGQAAQIPHIPEGAERTDIVRASEDALIALGNHAEILRRYGLNRGIAADGWLYGEDKTADTDWEYLSIREVHADERGVIMRYPSGSTSDIEDLPPDKHTLIRFWQAHPAFSNLADGPLLSLTGDCRRLIALNDSIDARLLSRLSSAGILFIPNTITIAGEEVRPDGSTQPQDAVLAKLKNIFEQAILHRGTAAGSIPVMMRGQSGEGEKIVHITLDRSIDETEMKLRAELRESIAGGMDLERETQTGLGDASHWSTWSITDSTYSNHLAPGVEDFTRDLTRTYLRNAVPQLLGRALTAQEQVEFRRVVIFGDGSNVVTRPNRTKDGIDLNDRAVISDKSLRQRAGASEDEAPDDNEYVRQIGRKNSDPYLATFGLPVQDKIDWDKVSTRQPGAPGPGGQGQDPASKRPVDNGGGGGDGSPGSGDAGKTQAGQ